MSFSAEVKVIPVTLMLSKSSTLILIIPKG